MIPADLASRLRLTLPAPEQEQPAPVTNAQKITDALSDLVPGQKVLAQIQSLLPNGTYRAIVAQRDVALALPFSAKPGDSLELEVVESDGKISLAFVANRTSGEPSSGKQNDSVATTLSQTGKLIGHLLGDVDNQGKRAAPAPLNGNQPLVEDFPDLAANLAPILKDALTKSGVFYEAHQARWVAGELPTEALRQEPQGKTPPKIEAAAVNSASDGKLADAGKAETASVNQSASTRSEQPAQTNSPGTPIPRDLTPIVQQQLDALATQNYAWQGQIWPGQKMQWEIGENLDGNRNPEADPVARWQTRLKLSLPGLGGVDATLSLRSGGALDITVTADSASGETRLRDGGSTLHKQLESAGLTLTQFLVRHGETAE